MLEGLTFTDKEQAAIQTTGIDKDEVVKLQKETRNRERKWRP